MGGNWHLPTIPPAPALDAPWPVKVRHARAIARQCAALLARDRKRKARAARRRRRAAGKGGAS